MSDSLKDKFKCWETFFSIIGTFPYIKERSEHVHFIIFPPVLRRCAFYLFILPVFEINIHVFLHKVSMCTILHLATFIEYILEHGVSAHKKHPKSFHICIHFIVSVHHILSNQT